MIEHPRSTVSSNGAWRRVAWIAALSLALVVFGCQRRTNIVLIPGDSTGTASLDSSGIELRNTQQLWDAGNAEAASAATAKLLLHEFAMREPGAWHDRAGDLLDSLGIGGEFADGPCALVVNLFSRSDPEGGSWPYLYWCGKSGPLAQALEGKNLHLNGMVARGLVTTGVGTDSVRRVAVSFLRRAAGGLQPLVTTWALPPSKGTERWMVLQTLGADSLGGFGTAQIEGITDTGAELAVRTYRTPSGFVECATCPHVYVASRFHWTPQGFVRDSREEVPSPYVTFTKFIAALVASDQMSAEEYVADPTLVLKANGMEWNLKKGPWRPAPGVEGSPLHATFFRGQKDAYTVDFRAQGRGYVITGFDPVTRAE